MSRPKGSKNKKTLLMEAQLGDRIVEKKAEKKALESRLKKLENEMENLKQKLKQTRKDLRTADRTLIALQERKAETEAIAAAAAQKKEIEQVVSTLISSGKDADEILKLLKK